MELMITSWRRINALDLALCLRCNRFSRIALLRQLFCVISRLGNGVFWYAFAALLPLYCGGQQAIPVVLRMLVVGITGLLLYKWLKAKTSRPRPYEVYAAIAAKAPALDRFSFPSGHTLHAVAFSTVITSGLPELGWLLWPFTVLVGLSRPVLGLHYPSDVLAGAAIGLSIAQLVIAI